MDGEHKYHIRKNINCLRYSDGVDADESLRLSGVVVKGIASTLDIHGSQISVVQSVGAGLSLHDTVSLVELDFDLSDDVSLTKIERVLDQFHLWCKPESVVAQPGNFVGHTLCGALHFTVHANAL